MRRSRKRIVLLALTAAVLIALIPAAGIGSTDATRVSAESYAAAAKPRNLKIVINGRTLTAKQTAEGADTYLKVRAGRLTVGSKWTGNVKGSGYYILIADSGSTAKKRCRVGTKCTIVSRGGIKKNQEMNWAIQIIRSRTGTLASQKVICLVGVA